MRRTAFTELIGCDIPLQCAAMSGVADASLTAAVSNAGGLGMVGAGSRDASAVATLVDATLALTDRPFGVGFITEFIDEDAVALAVERAAAVEFTWGRPDAALVADRPLVGWQVESVEMARAAIDVGCSYVVLQGVEAGGHVRGNEELDRLLGEARETMGDEPVLVACGGIGTAADVRRLLDSGADAVRIGTRFVAAVESAAHDRYVELLSEAGDGDTELSESFWVGWPEAQHRVLTSAVEASGDGDDFVGTMPGPGDERRRVPRFSTSPPTREFDGLIDAMALYAGTGSVGAVNGRATAAEIIAELTALIDD